MNINKVYILHGMQGSGKSTFIKENDLIALSLSKDKIRESVSGLELSEDGEVGLSQIHNSYVEGIFNQMLDYRLKKGGILIIDNMNINENDITRIKSSCESYGYDYVVVNFNVLSIEEILERNRKREPQKRINEEHLISVYEKLKKGEVLENNNYITPKEMIDEIKISYNDLRVDLNKYKKIHHFGDLQGTYTPLEKYFKKHGGIKDDEFYIFLGDYIDRGKENGKSVRFVLDNIEKENFIFIKGNHEIHLRNYAYGHNVYSSEFKNLTQRQIKEEGIKRNEIKKIIRNLKDFYLYEYKGKNIILSHGGISKIPEFPKMVSGEVYHKGLRSYGFDIEKSFTQKAQEGWYQLHGHRNVNETSFLNKEMRSWSLESNVEKNGHLTIITLDKNGFEIEKINSPKLIIDKKEKTIESKMKEFNEDIIERMQSHSLIKEKIMKNSPHISSFNFTREAFFNKDFNDEIVTQARGLFINNETNEIIARGYNKFFNINEKGIESASENNLRRKMKGEITAFKKENGFLGILGYDEKEDKIIVASKSTIEGDFAEYFRKILEDTLSKENIENIKAYMKQRNKSLVFEVNDPINDPHIVKYKKAHIVLLDIIDRNFEFKRESYKKLVSFGEKYGLKVKEKGIRFKNIEEFIKFNDAVANENPLTTKKKFEGYVAEDSEGNMIKIKLPYYNYWKQMRGVKDRIRKYKVKEGEKIKKSLMILKKVPKENKENFLLKNKVARQKERDEFVEKLLDNAFFIKEEQYADAREFIGSIILLNDDELKKDIIKLREDFEKKQKKMDLKIK